MSGLAKVMFSQASLSHSVHNRPHGYSVPANPCYGAVGSHPTRMLSCSTGLYIRDGEHLLFFNPGHRTDRIASLSNIVYTVTAAHDHDNQCEMFRRNISPIYSYMMRIIFII